MTGAADISQFPENCHPETESKDPYRQGAVSCVPTIFHRSARTIFFLAAVAVPSLMVAQTQAFRAFPGPKSDYLSPDHHYAVRDVERSEEPHHSIVLIDKTTGKTSEIYGYLSQVGISWAPDSKHFWINDSSRVHVAYVFDVDAQEPRIDLQHELQQKANIDPTSGDNQFDIAMWLDSERLVALSWRYANNRPQRVSCHCYVYALNGAVEACSKHPETPDLERLCPELLKRP